MLTSPEGGSRTAPTKSIGRLIGAFKTVSTKHVNEWRETPGMALWQRDFYEHIIRNDDDLATHPRIHYNESRTLA